MKKSQHYEKYSLKVKLKLLLPATRGYKLSSPALLIYWAWGRFQFKNTFHNSYSSVIFVQKECIDNLYFIRTITYRCRN